MSTFTKMKLVPEGPQLPVNAKITKLSALDLELSRILASGSDEQEKARAYQDCLQRYIDMHQTVKPVPETVKPLQQPKPIMLPQPYLPPPVVQATPREILSTPPRKRRKMERSVEEINDILSAPKKPNKIVLKRRLLRGAEKWINMSKS